MRKPPPKQRLLLFAIYLLSGCISTHKLPRLLPISEDRYPPVSRRVGEEGRVLIEFNLDDRRRLIAPRITQSEGSARLDAAALRLIRTFRSTRLTTTNRAQNLRIASP
jgi:TonB family protein